MNDRAVSLLEQYEIEVLRTRKGRGAIVCDTSQGCLIFKEYTGTADRIKMQQQLLDQILLAGRVSVEHIVLSKDGELLVKDNDGSTYVLKTYFEGKECNIYEKTECAEAVRTLARLHSSMQRSTKSFTDTLMFWPEKEYEKRNRELKKVRKYLRQKGQKNWFEISLQQIFDYFLEQAQTVTQKWQTYCSPEYLELRQGLAGYCHGDYQYHNIIHCENEWCIINFEKCLLDNPIRDLYLLLRKLLEKSNWSVSLGTELLEAYEQELPIADFSKIDLYYRLAYPEKFWKIVNFYFNSGKAWIPERNLEKLEKLIEQEKEKQNFLQVVFRENLGL